jgi:DNA-binding transcriptional regulator LsrR (DeoR family)
MATNNAELEELTTIRKLLVLALLRSGMTQSELGAALGVHRTQIGRMFPKGALAEAGKKEKKGVEGN